MPRNQKVDFPTMVLIESKTLVNLCLRQGREGAGKNAINGLAILKQADDIMDANARAFDNGIAAANSWDATNIPIAFRGCCHNLVIHTTRRG